MLVLRRFLTGLLVVALAQFGALAAAPAHAHEGGSGQGVREIVLSHTHAGAERSNADHHDDVDDRGDNGDHSDDAGLSMSSDGVAPLSNDGSHGEPAHVHGFQQFAAAQEVNAPYVPAEYAEVVRPAETTAAVRHSSFPPLRPPRASL